MRGYSAEVVFCTWVDGKTTENNENSQTGSQVPCQKSEKKNGFVSGQIFPTG